MRVHRRRLLIPIAGQIHRVRKSAHAGGRSSTRHLLSVAGQSLAYPHPRAGGRGSSRLLFSVATRGSRVHHPRAPTTITPTSNWWPGRPPCPPSRCRPGSVFPSAARSLKGEAEASGAPQRSFGCATTSGCTTHLPGRWCASRGQHRCGAWTVGQRIRVPRMAPACSSPPRRSPSDGNLSSRLQEDGSQQRSALYHRLAAHRRFGILTDDDPDGRPRIASRVRPPSD